MSDRLVPDGKGMVMEMESDVWVHVNGHTFTSSVVDIAGVSSSFASASAADDAHSSADRIIHPSTCHPHQYGRSPLCSDQLASSFPGPLSTEFSNVGSITTSMASNVFSCLPSSEGMDGRVNIRRHSEVETRWAVLSRKGVSRSYLAVNFPVNGSP